MHSEPELLESYWVNGASCAIRMWGLVQKEWSLEVSLGRVHPSSQLPPFLSPAMMCAVLLHGDSFTMAFLAEYELNPLKTRSLTEYLFF